MQCVHELVVTIGVLHLSHYKYLPFLQVRLFDLSSSGFMFRRSLHRQESRVLSIAWHPSGEHLVTGGMDSTLRIIGVSSALCMQRISLDDYKEKSTLVWDVKFIDNSSVVTADSLGKVQVWDYKYGTLEGTFNHHLADVLTLTVQAGENGNTSVFASGVDSKIVKMSRISTEEGSKGTEWKWILSGQNRPHQHDVSSLDISSTGLLASGGIEGQLVITNCNHLNYSTYIKQQPFPCMARHLKVAEKGNMLLCQDVSAVSIWRISEHCLAPSSMTNTKKRETSHKIQIPTSKPSFDFNPSVEKHTPLCLLQLKANPPHNILSSAISEDGTLMAVSNCDEMWVYGFNARTLQLRLLTNLQCPSFAMHFMPKQQEIILATIHDGLKRAIIDTCGCIEAALVLGKGTEQVKNFELSGDGQLLAAITRRWRVLVVDLVTGSLVAKLPKLQSLPVVCTFNPAKPELLVFAGGESRELFVYSVVDDCLKCFGRVRKGVKGEVYEGRTKLSHPIAVIPISFEQNLFAVYDNDCAMMFRLTSNSVQDLAKPSIKKPQKRTRPPDVHLPTQLIKSASLVLFVGVFSASVQEEKTQSKEIEAGTESKQGLIIVERCWRDVLKALPPTLYRKRFGT